MSLPPIRNVLFILAGNDDGLRGTTAFVVVPHQEPDYAGYKEHGTQDKPQKSATATAISIFFDNRCHSDAPVFGLEEAERTFRVKVPKTLRAAETMSSTGRFSGFFSLDQSGPGKYSEQRTLDDLRRTGRPIRR
jgi:hypothetical protein